MNILNDIFADVAFRFSDEPHTHAAAVHCGSLALSACSIPDSDPIFAELAATMRRRGMKAKVTNALAMRVHDILFAGVRYASARDFARRLLDGLDGGNVVKLSPP